MKDFQLNYTTPAQSKWLLGLGVPALSANIVYLSTPDSPYDPYIVDDSNKKFLTNGKGLPCWSVGRLIEIHHICDRPGCTFSFNVCFPNLVSEMIHKISLAKERGWIDFSKLEDFMKRSNVELNDEE